MTSEKQCNELSGKEWLQNSFSIWRDLAKTKEEKDLKHPASFPVVLCEKLIKTFSKANSHILDPFNGIGSTMVATKNLNRHGVGIDLSNEFCDIAKKRIGQNENISIVNGDSLIELEKLQESSFDLCLTSPPYWDILNMKRSVDGKEIVNYSNKQKDLGNIKNYQEFLSLLAELFSKVYRVIKPNGYCIVNVMDIRKQSNFYPLHMDIVKTLEPLGFVLDDIIIWDRQFEYNNMKPLGYPCKFRINKVHEYILIFTKGGKK
ncbi:MAG: site-specific DNA-methyltransferase [Chitinivibrionia bacterium]|nr:site-specific DNA-methyltransferase [Chitinivibrionia bacterium]